jgi:hypothetical protein
MTEPAEDNVNEWPLEPENGASPIRRAVIADQDSDVLEYVQWAIHHAGVHGLEIVEHVTDAGQMFEAVARQRPNLVLLNPSFARTTEEVRELFGQLHVAAPEAWLGHALAITTPDGSVPSHLRMSFRRPLGQLWRAKGDDRSLDTVLQPVLEEPILDDLRELIFYWATLADPTNSTADVEFWTSNVRMAPGSWTSDGEISPSASAKVDVGLRRWVIVKATS